MLEKPQVQEEEIRACLCNEYGLAVHEITFLPLGAELSTAVFRISVKSGDTYFFKLCKGFDPASVLLPHFLCEQGIQQIIPILPTQSGALWSEIGEFNTILYPYVCGQDAYSSQLKAPQWHELGNILRRFHTMDYPSELLQRIQKETYPHMLVIP